MKRFLKIATLVFITISSIGFASVLYGAIVNSPWLKLIVSDSLGLNLYLTIIGTCFIALFFGGVTHFLYLQWKLYEQN